MILSIPRIGVCLNCKGRQSMESSRCIDDLLSSASSSTPPSVLYLYHVISRLPLKAGHYIIYMLNGSVLIWASGLQLKCCRYKFWSFHGSYNNYRSCSHMYTCYKADPCAQASEVGVCRGSDTPTIYVGGYRYVYPLKNLIAIHANCMQHVLRCWERQSDSREYKKTLRCNVM